jgi:hypothetical protein
MRLILLLLFTLNPLFAGCPAALFSLPRVTVFNQTPDAANCFTANVNYNELNETNVRRVLKAYGIKFPDIVMCQILLETNHFKSNICITNNNVTGMKFSYHRPSTAIYEAFHSAGYENWQASIMDYKLRTEYYQGDTCTTEQSYYNFLRRSRYCTTTGYLRILKTMVKKMRYEKI